MPASLKAIIFHLPTIVIILGIAIVAGLASGCSSVNVADADSAYSRGEYHAAREIYRKAYNALDPQKQKEEKGRVAFRLAECNSRLNMPAHASRYYGNALRYQYPDSTIYFRLARALQGEGKYQEAIDAYTNFLGLFPDDALAREGISGCRKALLSTENHASRLVVRPSKVLSTRRADYCPMFAPGDTERIYFTSTSEKTKGENNSGVTGLKRGDIFYSKKNEIGVWQLPQPVEGEINTDADEGSVAFSPDGRKMYFSRATLAENADASVAIFVSERNDASWSEPEKIHIDGDSIFDYAHPAVSHDGRFLIFSSNLKGGYGGYDLWRLRLDSDNALPVNLGPQINTPGDEFFPYVRNDSVIFFSSDGHPGFGGLDIFKAHLDSSGTFWNVENVGPPLNGKGDDFGITFGEGEKGYFSSNRDDARGRDHIFSFELPPLNISISGTVTDRDEEPVPGAVIRIVGDDGTNRRQRARDDGSFSFDLDRGVRYAMKAGAPGYLNVKQEFTSDDTEEDAAYEIDFILTAIGRPQVVENIFYDFDKATLRPESEEALDQLAEMLRENPTVTIELGSHTDRKGTEEYNLALSERRAKSVVDYLIGKGIAADRLVSKGYGESVPKTVTRRINRKYPQLAIGTILSEEFISSLPESDRETADQINRRTEFSVLSTDYE